MLGLRPAVTGNSVVVRALLCGGRDGLAGGHAGHAAVVTGLRAVMPGMRRL
jgi:hypothetical protein